MTKRICASAILLMWAVIGSSVQSSAEPLKLVAWNLESGGITRSKIGEQLREFDGVQLWALSEVQASNADFFIASAGVGEAGEISGLVGNTGGADRLLILLDESRFELIEGYELSDLALGGRAPLVAHLRQRDDGSKFLFVAVHLHRRDGDKRLQQARELRDWAADSALPIIVAGDFNFDFEVPSGPGNAAFDEFALAEILDWERPATLVASQYSDSNDDGENDHDSVLDFVWSAGGAKSWGIQTEILVRPGDFPDDNRTSDHRPIVALIETEAAEPAADVPSRTLRIARSRLSDRESLSGAAVPRADPPHIEAMGAARAVPQASAQRPESFGRFEGRVVATWDDAGRDMTLLEDFHFIDSGQRRWTAPSGAIVNGASIPRSFWTVIGGPFEGRYRNASVIHDVYCESQSRPWRDVHRMFYDASRCGGAGRVQSKLMYYAVYHFGPRWGESPDIMATAERAPLDEQEVVALQAYIEWKNPSLEELETISPASFHEQH